MEQYIYCERMCAPIVDSAEKKKETPLPSFPEASEITPSTKAHKLTAVTSTLLRAFLATLILYFGLRMMRDDTSQPTAVPIP